MYNFFHSQHTENEDDQRNREYCEWVAKRRRSGTVSMHNHGTNQSNPFPPILSIGQPVDPMDRRAFITCKKSLSSLCRNRPDMYAK